MDGDKRFLALRVPGQVSDRAAETLIRTRSETAGWGALEIRVFPGVRETLLLARPAEGVYIPEKVLRLLDAHSHREPGP